MHVKPPARTHTAAPRCGSHCHRLGVRLTPQFLWRQAHAQKLVEEAKAEVALKHYAAAADLLKSAVALDDSDDEPKLMLRAVSTLLEAQLLEAKGLALAAARQHTAALACFEQALALKPGRPVLLLFSYQDHRMLLP